MDWNAKMPSQWDYESLVMFNANVGEMPRLAQSSEWGIENGSIYSSGGGVCSGSEAGNGCSSKSSVSASIDSAPRAGPGPLMITFDAASMNVKKKELCGIKDVRNTPELTGSIGSMEPLIGLKLGKRTYFEDFCATDNSKNLSFRGAPMPSPTATKKSKVAHQSLQKSRCQVEGCNVDLSTAKGYHRKHKVCESHSKCSIVVVAGNERRFCQQCSRFHDLSEFDQKKRSCRRRLFNHNARRRKPPPQALSCNSARISSSLYDDRQQMNLSFNGPPFGHMRPENSTWESSCNFNLTPTNGVCIRSAKAGNIGGQLYLPSSELSMTVSTVHNLDRFLPSKGTTAEVLNQGLEASAIASNLDGAPDFRRALSLLSTDSWGSAPPGSTSINQLPRASHASSTQTAVQVVHPSFNYWQAAGSTPQETRVHPFPLHSDGNQFQEFHLLKEPCGTAFFDSHHIN